MTENCKDYLDGVRKSNRKLFAASKIQMTPESLLDQLKTAFEAGERAAALPDFGELFGNLSKKGTYR